MDEIKLDQFFIHRGISEKRDDIILENVIKLGKSLNMKVTQEGVQTPEQLERIKSFGCDVVQGYYYSKPLPLWSIRRTTVCLQTGFDFSFSNKNIPQNREVPCFAVNFVY